MKTDLRWKQRFENYLKALRSMDDTVSLLHKRELSELEKKVLFKILKLLLN